MKLVRDCRPEIIINKDYLRGMRKNYCYYHEKRKYKSFMGQKELAHKLSRCERQIIRYEDNNSTTLPSAEMIKQMALIFNLDLYKLFGLQQYEVNEDEVIDTSAEGTVTLED